MPKHQFYGPEETADQVHQEAQAAGFTGSNHLAKNVNTSSILSGLMASLMRMLGAGAMSLWISPSKKISLKERLSF